MSAIDPKLREACAVSVGILEELVAMVAPGVTAAEIDAKALALCAEHEVKPAFKGYAPRGLTPFPYAASICIDQEVVHGFSGKDKVIKPGQIVTVDFGIVKDGFYTDQCVSVGVGELHPDKKRLLETAKLAVLAGANQARTGKHTGDVGFAISTIADMADFGVVREYIGHGIGKRLHQPPDLPGYGRPGYGALLAEGMVLCVEAQLTLGSADIIHKKDGWTVETADGSPAAWFEYMVAVGREPQFLTDTRNWPLFV